ncbi:hypothetical protein N7519_002108 [Penicillium mononematosum]|uniref:uncharacterized protein n=1 Tax=Penicillium mononematosum TaxID=268346 RepID=UPI0025479AA9|nr:uncharacterized protein N7519_002108 [Penicillium mononematosum]KAJ6187200.1 hypothetical protein N7519_002108 [Penicillium mononematosum]
MRPSTVGIVSIEEMGPVNTHWRESTQKIEILPSDQALVIQVDYVLSIVPLQKAAATAQRIARTAVDGQSPGGY